MRFLSLLPRWEREPTITELSFKQEDDERLSSSYFPTSTPTSKHSIFLYGRKAAYMIAYMFQDSFTNSDLRFQFYDEYRVARTMDRIRRDLVSYVDIRATEERNKPVGGRAWGYDDVCDIVDTSTSKPFKIAVETRYHYGQTTLCRQLYLNNSPQFLL